MVSWGEVTVADDDDRFIPLGDDAIYAYSDGGSERDWTLPEAFVGAALEVFALSREGRTPFKDYRTDGATIRLNLPPRAPVKIVRKS
jgi:hypothetical protein